DDVHLDRGVGGGFQSAFTQIALRLDREDLGNGGGVVGKVGAVPGPDLDHSPSETGEELATMLRRASAVSGIGDPRIEPGEDRMMDFLRFAGLQLRHVRWPPLQSTGLKAGATGSARWVVSARPPDAPDERQRSRRPKASTRRA